MTYVCPNGHEFPAVVAVECEDCEARVSCVPWAEARRLHDLLERAELAVEEGKTIRRALARSLVRSEAAVARAHDALDVEHGHTAQTWADRQERRPC